MLREVAPASLPSQQPEEHEADHHDQLSGCEYVLYLGGASDAETVQDGEDGNKRRRDGLPRSEPQGKCAGAEYEARVALAEIGEKVGQIIREGERRGGDRGRKAGEEGDPSGHESPLGPVGVRKIHVFAAGAGKVDAQFRVTQRAGEGEDRPDGPAGENPPRAAEIARHQAGSGEDASAHHVGDDKGRGAKEAELTQQARVGTRARGIGHSGLWPL